MDVSNLNSKNKIHNHILICFENFSGIIDENNIKNYSSYRNEMVTKCNSISFKNAVVQLEEYMSDRSVCNIISDVKLLGTYLNLHLTFLFILYQCLEIS